MVKTIKLLKLVEYFRPSYYFSIFLKTLENLLNYYVFGSKLLYVFYFIRCPIIIELTALWRNTFLWKLNDEWIACARNFLEASDPVKISKAKVFLE